MGRGPCCAKEGLNRGAWTAAEDKMLTDYITAHGEGGWRNLPKRAGLKRCGKSCRLRWLNYLRPDIKRGNISEDEEELIIRLHKLLGNRWSLIAGRLPGRTDNEIKNYWNTTICKKVQDNKNNNNIIIINNNNSNYKYCESAAASPTIKLPKQKQKPTKTVSEPRAIRPKAFRCCAAAKVCINDQQPGIEEESQPLLAAATDAFRFEDDDYMPSTTLDFLLDFNSIGELCLSDLLNQEFSLQDDMINGNMIHDHHVLTSSHDSTTPEEIMSPELAVNGGHNTSTTTHSDVLSFTSFLDCQVADDHQFELIT